MFEIEYEPKQKVKIFGKEYELSKPTTSQAQEMAESLESSGGSNSKAISIMVEMMSKLGLPKEVAGEIPPAKFADLVQFMIGSKKN